MFCVHCTMYPITILYNYTYVFRVTFFCFTVIYAHFQTKYHYQKPFEFKYYANVQHKNMFASFWLRSTKIICSSFTLVWRFFLCITNKEILQNILCFCGNIQTAKQPNSHSCMGSTCIVRENAQNCKTISRVLCCKKSPKKEKWIIIK